MRKLRPIQIAEDTEVIIRETPAEDVTIDECTFNLCMMLDFTATSALNEMCIGMAKRLNLPPAVVMGAFHHWVGDMESKMGITTTEKSRQIEDR